MTDLTITFGLTVTGLGAAGGAVILAGGASGAGLTFGAWAKVVSGSSSAEILISSLIMVIELCFQNYGSIFLSRMHG